MASSRDESTASFYLCDSRTNSVWSRRRRRASRSVTIPTRFEHRTSASSGPIGCRWCAREAFSKGRPILQWKWFRPSDRAGDLLAKVRDWLSAGCQSVWVVDPTSQTDFDLSRLARTGDADQCRRAGRRRRSARFSLAGGASLLRLYDFRAMDDRRKSARASFRCTKWDSPRFGIHRL